MKTIQFFFLCFCSLFLAAQETVDYSSFKGQTTVTFKTVNYLENSSFCEYNIKRKPQAVQSYLLAANTSSPENLLSSLSFAKDEKEIAQLLLKQEDAAFDKQFEVMDKVDSTHYFLITEKLEFDWNNERVALLKYFKVEDERTSKPYSIQLQKQGDSWYITNNSSLFGLEFIIQYLKYKTLYKFLEKGDSGDETIDAIANKCLSDEGTLNYEKLYEALKYEVENNTAFSRKWMDL